MSHWTEEQLSIVVQSVLEEKSLHCVTYKVLCKLLLLDCAYLVLLRREAEAIRQVC
jgi:hypothetical protein